MEKKKTANKQDFDALFCKACAFTIKIRKYENVQW